MLAASMNTATLFAQSLVVGLSIAAPVGPIGLLVIQRSVQRGAAVGLATGGRLRGRFDAGAQRFVNRASALLLAAFALWPWATLGGIG